MIRLLALTLFTAAALAPASAYAQTPAAGDAQRGAQKVRMCQGCHGIPGWRTAFPEVYEVPKIAGQHATYIAKALEEYKTGDRDHPSMRSIAAQLSEQDMADLAAYYGQPEGGK